MAISRFHECILVGQLPTINKVSLIKSCAGPLQVVIFLVLGV